MFLVATGGWWCIAGIVEYYEDFAAALWDRLEGEVDVVCLGLVGHAGRRGLFPKGKVWTMHDQASGGLGNALF